MDQRILERLQVITPEEQAFLDGSTTIDRDLYMLGQEKRLSQAAFLLKSTDRNIADISVAVGYENISYFHRLFTQCFGLSPRQYRLQERIHF